ncbi:MAG: iron-sulfur cluster assembly accessory protein [Gammaproteobacteria bacterium]
MSVENAVEYSHEVGADDVTITPTASEHLATLFKDIDDDDIEAIRVYVAGSGCSGMTYGMTFTDRKTEYDKVLKGDGYLCYVDVVALSFLRGVEIDYATRDTGATFVFNNVFQQTGGSGTCGACGAAVGAGEGCS